MGNQQSIVTDIVNNVTMSTTTDFVNKNVMNQSTDSTNIQDMTINIGIADGCPIDASQKIKSKVQVNQSLDQQAVKNLQTQLKGELENALSQNSKMINGLAAMTGGNEQDVSASIRNTINQSIATRVTSENIMNQAVSSINIQRQRLNLAVCRNSPIKMSQDIASEIIAQNLMTQMTDDILKNEILAKAKTTVTQSTTMENKGFESIAAACAAVSGVVALLLLLGCIALLFMGGSVSKSKGGVKTTTLSAPGRPPAV